MAKKEALKATIKPDKINDKVKEVLGEKEKGYDISIVMHLYETKGEADEYISPIYQAEKYGILDIRRFIETSCRDTIEALPQAATITVSRSTIDKLKIELPGRIENNSLLVFYSIKEKIIRWFGSRKLYLDFMFDLGNYSGLLGGVHYKIIADIKVF